MLFKSFCCEAWSVKKRALEKYKEEKNKAKAKKIEDEDKGNKKKKKKAADKKDTPAPEKKAEAVNIQYADHMITVAESIEVDIKVPFLVLTPSYFKSVPFDDDEEDAEYIEAWFGLFIALQYLHLLA